MKMLKNLFASLLFAVLTFTASAQVVTHTINIASASTLSNVAVAIGDILHFTGPNPLTTFHISRVSPGTDTTLMMLVVSFDYTVTAYDNSYIVYDNHAPTPNMVSGTIHINIATGIESIKHTTTKLSVFPNPSTDEVSVTFNTNKEKTTIEVFDIEGRLVMTDETTREIGQNTVKINVSNFSQGIYIVRAGSERIRIIKE
jgi:hypothetical protein